MLTVSPIPESSPQSDSVSAMCQQLSFGLSLLTNKDDLSLNNNNQVLFISLLIIIFFFKLFLSSYIMYVSSYVLS